MKLPEVGPLDPEAMADARSRMDSLTKPIGSLGRLEDLAIQLAGITGDPRWTPGRRTIVVLAADHGIAARGVSAYPQAVTAQMVANFLGGGAAINVLARRTGADVLVVDIGVASAIAVPSELPLSVRFISQPVRRGTADMTTGPAMSRMEAEAAIEIGLDIAAAAIAKGTTILGLGEMGIANTSSASAIVAVMTGRSVDEVTGRGTGIDDPARALKVAALEGAISMNRPDPADPIGVLGAVGGFEIAGLAGVILGAATRRIPVVLDGFITGAAALVAAALVPGVSERLIASHRSAEPGHLAALTHLGRRPLLDLDLRLGEGTGAALVMSLVDAACAIREEMATFSSAGVATRSATTQPRP